VPTAETGGIEYRLRRSLADWLVLAEKLLLAGVAVERRGRLIGDVDSINQRPVGAGRKRGRMTGPKDKSFAIPKLLVGEAWRQVKANKGAPGVDGQDLDAFEADLENNLYKVWNRMSSGTWFAAPVRAVEIPKPHGGGTRMLGVPTIADRVAQTTVAMFLEPLVEPRFHQDSYGYRPGRSPHDAVAVCRQRCWKYDWAIDLDVQKFFDEVPWDLIVRAVEAVTDCRLGAVVCQAVDGCAATAPGWLPSSAQQRNPAGFGDFAVPGEPIHALRVRSVDGPELSGLSV